MNGSSTTKKKTNMLEGSAWLAILLFAIPIVIGNMLQQLYNTVDGVVVGRYVDSNALAAIGTCSTLARFFLCFSMGFSNGCGVMISQFYGARREADTKSAFSTGAVISVGIGVFISVVGIVFHNWILSSLMNIKDPEVLRYASTYFSIYCAGLIFTYAYNYIAYVLRAFGDSRATLYFLAISSILNLVLDMLMVKPFGIAGAAIATVISQIVCAIASYFYMAKRYPLLNMKLREYRIDKEKSRMCISLGIPGILQQCSVSIGNLAMQRLVNSFGSVTMAAYTVGTKIEGYLHAPITGIQQSMSVFAGQNIGARKLDRVKKGLYSAVAINVIVCVFMSLLMYFFMTPTIGLFALEGDAFTQAAEMVRFVSYGSVTMLLFGLYFSCSGVIHGSGDVGYATFISLFALATRVVISYVAVYAFKASYPILWQGTLVSNFLSMFTAWIRYYSGTWKKKSEKIVGKSAEG